MDVPDITMASPYSSPGLSPCSSLSASCSTLSQIAPSITSDDDDRTQSPLFQDYDENQQQQYRYPGPHSFTHPPPPLPVPYWHARQSPSSAPTAQHYQTHSAAGLLYQTSPLPPPPSPPPAATAAVAPPARLPPPLPPQPPHARYAQINTPYDFLVPYDYFSRPQGFKPYHFRQCYMPTSATYVVVEKGWSSQLDLDSWSQVLLRAHAGCWVGIRGRGCCGGVTKQGSSGSGPACGPAATRCLGTQLRGEAAAAAAVGTTANRPKIQVCPLLSTEMQRAIDRAVPSELEETDPKLFTRLKHLSHVEDQVVFLAIVQGHRADGAGGTGGDGDAFKLVAKATFYQIMTEMFHAASAGLSVVFTAIVRERDFARLGRGSKTGLAKMMGSRSKVGCSWKEVKSDVKFKRVGTYEELLEDDVDKNVVRVGC